MNWFSGKSKAQEQESRHSTAVAKTPVNPVQRKRSPQPDAFCNMPSIVLEQHWDDIIASLQDLFKSNILYYPDYQPKLVSEFKVMKKEFMLIDRHVITYDDNEQLKYIIVERIPELVQSIASLKVNQANTNENKEKRFLWLQNEIRIIHNNIIQISAKARAGSLRTFESREAVNELQSLPFPDLPTLQVELPQNLKEQLERISRIWEVEKMSPHSPETMYILDRMATEYIPMSLELYEKFVFAPEQVKEHADAALQAQFNLIEEHLKKVQKEVLDGYLKSMQTQTDFLQERFRSLPPRTGNEDQ